MRKKIWLLPVVVAVLLAVCVFRRVSTPSPASGGEVSPPAAAATATAPKPQPIKVPSPRAPKVSRPQPVVPDAATEAAPAEQEEPSGDWTPKVEAIIAGTGNRLHALVGDALVSEGSVVQGYRVRKVQADGVEFEKDGQIWVQRLD